jgi:hypothetical protein
MFADSGVLDSKRLNYKVIPRQMHFDYLQQHRPICISEVALKVLNELFTPLVKKVIIT